jgi:pimeloyl-ACP methyl ester carboxylesterase
MMSNPSPPRVQARPARPRAAAPWRLTAAAGVLAVGAAVQAPPAPAVAVPDPAAVITWQPCPQYSDTVVTALGFGDRIAEFRALWARAQCGTLQVPLDYSRPHGRMITIAFTRLPATDQAHRLGSLAVNPGGPGASGYLMPINLAMPGNATAALNTRYDLIGMDPRGIGYSTRIECTPDLGPLPYSPLPTKAQARQSYDTTAAANRACVAQDPAFMAQETTANVARDLNQIRIGLRERALSYFGVSWGTALGAVYRSLFPATAGRMWLDSVMGPDDTLTAYIDAQAAAYQADLGRFTAWVAARNSTYGFGTTAAQVAAALLAWSRDLDAHPVTFTGIPQPIDGGLVAFLATFPSPSWPKTAGGLKDLRDATGPTAPPSIQHLFTQQPPPPAGTPEQGNYAAGTALFCNAQPESFTSYWEDYQRLLARYPLVVRGKPFYSECAGWPLPVRPWDLRRNNTSLELSGHRWEFVTPYPWTLQMQSLIGGNVFTVNDDLHAGADFTTECTAHIVGYFDTGQPGTSQCPGFPVPSSAASSAQPLPSMTPAVPGTLGWMAGP